MIFQENERTFGTYRFFIPKHPKKSVTGEKLGAALVAQVFGAFPSGAQQSARAWRARRAQGAQTSWDHWDHNGTL